MSRIYQNEAESTSQQLLDQYNTDRAREFYKIVMGDNGFDIHYGIYDTPEMTMQEATRNTTHFMYAKAQTLNALQPSGRVLDLGAGFGGSAHILATAYGCSVTCVNFCPEQNEENLARAEELGIADKIQALEMDFHHLQPEWSDRYDSVWSEEAFCHASDKRQVLSEALRVLRPGGVLVFTDLMKGKKCKEGDEENFNERNAAASIIRSDEYLELCSDLGFRDVHYTDLSHHLPANYNRMAEKIRDNYDQLLTYGLSEEFLDKYMDSLHTSEIAALEQQLEWGCFVMRKNN